MSLFRKYRDYVLAALEAMQAAGELPPGLSFAAVTAEPPRDAAHGDISTNAAMVTAKPAEKNPREIAAMLAERLKRTPGITGVEIAGPGFVNLRLNLEVWHTVVAAALEQGPRYGMSDMGQGERINVEYVSANPTGPMHIGHARGAVVGDVLARLLVHAGYAVTKEYYINDAGAQVDVLARSAYLRYREARGADTGEIPAGLYPGEYLQPAGAALAEKYGGKFLEAPESEWLPEVREFAINAMMDMIRADLRLMGIAHDVFSSERALVDGGRVASALTALEKDGLVYQGALEAPKGKTPEDWEPHEQTLFRASRFGDDSDRPLKKSDGSYTYFASDIAYHYDKLQRGFSRMALVLGADHGGYVKRMKAAVAAMSGGKARIDMLLCQLVQFLDGGEPVKMSKRAGTFTTVRDVVEAVGADAVRFIMLTRKAEAALDFDLKKVTEQSRDNPVFYVQYAHARASSVLRHAREAGGAGESISGPVAAADLARLTHPGEIALIRQIALWPRAVESAAQAMEPHRIAFYLQDLAAAFHELWNTGKDDASLRFLVDGDAALTKARLALVRACAQTVACGLGVMGVRPVEEM